MLLLAIIIIDEKFSQFASYVVLCEAEDSRVREVEGKKSKIFSITRLMERRRRR